MKTKTIVIFLLVGLACVFCKVLLQPTPKLNPTPADPASTNISAAGMETLTNNPGTNTVRDAYVKEHLATLAKLQSNDDAESLQAILSDLTNSEKTVRFAAIESTIQFGSRDAIPVLNNLAARTGDDAEKTKLLNAAEYLALPTLTEIRRQDPHVKVDHVAPANGSSSANPP